VPSGAAVGQTITFEFDGLRNAACECLAANYRVSPAEVSLLGLLDGGVASKILDALADWPTAIRLAEQLQKKKTEDATIPRLPGT
jgi:hypothetical protein